MKSELTQQWGVSQRLGLMYCLSANVQTVPAAVLGFSSIGAVPV